MMLHCMIFKQAASRDLVGFLRVPQNRLLWKERACMKGLPTRPA